MSNPPPVNASDGDAVPAEAATPVTGPQRRSQPCLPLEARQHPSTTGWTVALPLRADFITVEKEVVVRERIVVRTEAVEDQVRLEDTIQREQLQVTTAGRVPGLQSGAAEPVVLPAAVPQWRGVGGSTEEQGRAP